MQYEQHLPLYIQIRDHLRDQVNDGIFLPGTAIPSEAELSERYGVSNLTIRSALKELEREGYLLSVQGKGVFVVGMKLERDLDQLSGFTQTMRELKQVPKNSVISSYIREAGELYSGIFHISSEDMIHVIKRVQTANSVPVSLETIYVPVEILPNLPGLNVVDFSLYDIYDFYGINPTHAEQTLEIVRLDKHESRMLDIDTDQAVFRFESTTYAKDIPIEHAITYVRNDLCRFQVEFKDQ